jgi:acyl-CoA thioester hydrolase
MEKNHFKFKTSVRVRSYEVDWQGIVHNSVYMLYCEIGRVEYLKNIGADLDLNRRNSENRIVLSRNEIDYKSPAHFDMKIDIFTRIAEIGTTSFIFEGMLRDASTDRLIATNRAFHVWLDPRDLSPMEVPEEFRKLVRQQEGTNLMENRAPRDRITY